MVNVTLEVCCTPPLMVPPPSVKYRVTEETPLASAAGVKVNVPSDAILGATEKRPEFVTFVTTKLGVCVLSLAGPTVIPVAQAAE